MVWWKIIYPSKKARLQTLLEESEWAREQYVRFMDMSASMGHYAEELIGDDFESLVNPISKIQLFDLFLLFCQLQLPLW